MRIIHRWGFPAHSALQRISPNPTLSIVPNMPELPEVETMCRGISTVEGRTIISAGRIPCRRRPITVNPRPAVWKQQAVGQIVTTITRIGKRVVLVLSNDCRIVFEPRMTGLVLLADPPSTQHLRFQLDFSTARSPLKLQYWDRRGLGSVRLFSAAEFDRQFLTGNLGPDALAVDVQELQQRFLQCRVAVKPALLNQKRLAGVGNLYASELLFQAGVHPELRCDQLADHQWAAIHEAMKSVLNMAIHYEGSTLSDGTYRTALNQAGGFQNHHRVYDREGQSCRKCGSRIQRIVQVQRATFFCPNCQKLPF